MKVKHDIQIGKLGSDLGQMLALVVRELKTALNSLSVARATKSIAPKARLTKVGLRTSSTSSLPDLQEDSGYGGPGDNGAVSGRRKQGYEEAPNVGG